MATQAPNGTTTASSGSPASVSANSGFVAAQPAQQFQPAARPLSTATPVSPYAPAIGGAPMPFSSSFSPPRANAPTLNAPQALVASPRQTQSSPSYPAQQAQQYPENMTYRQQMMLTAQQGMGAGVGSLPESQYYMNNFGQQAQTAAPAARTWNPTGWRPSVAENMNTSAGWQAPTTPAPGSNPTLVARAQDRAAREKARVDAEAAAARAAAAPSPLVGGVPGGWANYDAYNQSPTMFAPNYVPGSSWSSLDPSNQAGVGRAPVNDPMNFGLRADGRIYDVNGNVVG